ncbi:MAG: type II toxin-antitoxin system HicA family toxin [Nitrososphaerales archaeon]
MSLPSAGWIEILKALHKIGFDPVGEKGSHIVVQHKDGGSRLCLDKIQLIEEHYMEFRMWCYRRNLRRC